MSRLDAVTSFCEGVPKGGERWRNDQSDQSSGDPMSQYAVNLINKAAEGKIDPLIGFKGVRQNYPSSLQAHQKIIRFVGDSKLEKLQ